MSERVWKIWYNFSLQEIALWQWHGDFPLSSTRLLEANNTNELNVITCLPTSECPTSSLALFSLDNAIKINVQLDMKMGKTALISQQCSIVWKMSEVEEGKFHFNFYRTSRSEKNAKEMCVWKRREEKKTFSSFHSLMTDILGGI